MRLVRNVRFAGLLALTTTVLMLAVRPAWAATITVTDLTEQGALIGAEVQEAVFGINMTAPGGATFDGLSVVLADVGGDGDFNLSELSDLQANPAGVAVYRDEGTDEDELDAEDALVSTFGHDGAGSVTLSVSSTIPDSAEGSYTYFLVVETSAGISTGDDFTVQIPPGPLLGCAFDTTPATGGLLGDPCPASDTTETITADATVPTATLTSTPTTADGNVVWTFNEDVTGVSTDNVVLRESGSPDNIAAAVTYDSGAHTATINPDGALSPGTAYDTIVNPASATDLVVDGAGNPVANTADAFSLPGIGYTPGIVRGNIWFLNSDYDPFHDITFAFGRATDFPVVGDWDKDGDFTPGVVRGNVWYLNNGFDDQAEIAFAFGRATDFPVVGDWDKDGDFTPGLVRGNVWYLNNGFDATHDVTFAFGRATDYPVVGDWDDDGDFTAGIVRGNQWFLNNDFDALHDVTFAFGRATDFPLVGDWDDDGDSTPGVARDNLWFLNNGFDDLAELGFAFGKADDYPVVGDWDGPSAAAAGAPNLPRLPLTQPG